MSRHHPPTTADAVVFGAALLAIICAAALWGWMLGSHPRDPAPPAAHPCEVTP